MTSSTFSMRCIGCGYDLRNLAAARCPECGRTFDADDWHTYLTDAHSIDGSICLRASLAALLLPAFGIVLTAAFQTPLWLIIMLMLSVIVAGAVLWDAWPGVMGWTDLIEHRPSMIAGCVLAGLVVCADIVAIILVMGS